MASVCRLRRKMAGNVIWSLFSTLALICLLLGTSRVAAIADQFKELHKLILGASLTPEENTTYLVSSNQTFCAGFYHVGDNAYTLAIWYARTLDRTVVWMANRDQAVNGRNSRLHLQTDGNLLLLAANGSTVWETHTAGSDFNVREALLLGTGKLVLCNSSGQIVWQSFDHPTDTLLPNQPLKGNSQLSSRLGTDAFKSGYYYLYFDYDNILRLRYESSDTASNYWPTPSLAIFANGRSPYNFSRSAALDDLGGFQSSDQFNFTAWDYGRGPKRRLTLDVDGNLRLYTLKEDSGRWNLSWIALEQCEVHGMCGPNGLCIYSPKPTCTCPPGFHVKEPTDWFKGCKRNIQFVDTRPDAVKFIYLPHTHYYGYNLPEGFVMGLTVEECKRRCTSSSDCEGFSYVFDGTGKCYRKGLLLNGYRSPGVPIDMYIKVSSNHSSPLNSTSMEPIQLNCSRIATVISNNFKESKKRSVIKYPLGFAVAFGVTEIVCISLGWWYMFRTSNGDADHDLQGYSAIPMGFKRFSFTELKKATDNFKVSLGQGSFGTVYKGMLPDNKVLAVKQLEGVSQSEDQFWAEVAMIGRVHHMNLVRMFGFCAEGRHRLLVYEYVEKGSLDRYLFTANEVLGWKERFEIAVGTARGLAYLHEECLEWILHCDIKPQNILLDHRFCPKVSDFGLAKLVDKVDKDRALTFSTIRGTRGYMAPEWVMNLPITAKADVYSFGIVLLEIVIGQSTSNIENVQSGKLAQWVSEKSEGGNREEEVVDPKLDGNFNSEEVGRALRTALLCVQQDKDRRPSMSQVVEMLSE